MTGHLENEGLHSFYLQPHRDYCQKSKHANVTMITYWMLARYRARQTNCSHINTQLNKPGNILTCTYIYLVCVHGSTYSCLYIHIYVCVYMYMLICTCIFIYIYMYVCISTQIWMYEFVWGVCVCVRVHTSTYTSLLYLLYVKILNGRKTTVSVSCMIYSVTRLHDSHVFPVVCHSLTFQLEHSVSLSSVPRPTHSEHIRDTDDEL